MHKIYSLFSATTIKRSVQTENWCTSITHEFLTFVLTQKVINKVLNLLETLKTFVHKEKSMEGEEK